MMRSEIEKTRLKEYQEAARQVNSCADDEAVHSYRIAARRLQSLLALWRPLIYVPRLERKLGQAVNSLSALRDAQVHAQKFGSKVSKAPPGVVLPLFEPVLRDWWEQREAWGNQPQLGIIYAMALGHRLLMCLDRPEPWALRDWHQLRLQVKEARYAIELLVCAGIASPSWLSELTEWQELLGQLQDRRQWLKRLPGQALSDEEQSARAVSLQQQIEARLATLIERKPLLRQLALGLLRTGRHV